MPGSPERDAHSPAPGAEGQGRASDAMRTAGFVAGADMEARLARQRVASALFGATADVLPGRASRSAADGTVGVTSSGAPERVGGRYELERPLGAGGMGVVYAAWDPELQRRVAIKLIHEDLERAAARARLGALAIPPRADGQAERAAKTQARMLREARALARLSHPNVIHVYDVGTHDGQLFVAMELVEGETLRRWLDAEPRERRRVMEHLLAAGRGLEAAHRSGLVHRDFKPENVLIGTDGRVRVVDFGLARLMEPVDTIETEETAVPSADRAGAPPNGAVASPLQGGPAASTKSTAFEPSATALDPITLAGALVGTPRYMAPEQLDGLPADSASDQFAFCVTAWEAITGRPPFVAATVDELRGVIRAGALEAPAASPRHTTRPPEIRSWLALLERGFQHDPSRRWSSMTELLAALSLALAKPKARRRTSKRTVALAMVLGASVMAALPLLLGPRAGSAVASFPGSIATSAAKALLKVAPPAPSTAAASSRAEAPSGWVSAAGAAGAAGGPAQPRHGADEAQASAGAEAAWGHEASVALPEATPASGPETPAAAVSAAGKADTGTRDTCHLHEDSYELLDRGAKRRQLEHDGTCFECRVERRRSRTSRFSPADCGAYALCAPSASDTCR